MQKLRTVLLAAAGAVAVVLGAAAITETLVDDPDQATEVPSEVRIGEANPGAVLPPPAEPPLPPPPAAAPAPEPVEPPPVRVVPPPPLYDEDDGGDDGDDDDD